MTLPTNLDQLERIKFVPDASGEVAVRTIFGAGNPTIYAIVNTGAVGNQNSLATLLAGPNQIGSVTISHPIQISSGTSYIGLASVNIGGTLPALTTGSAYIGLVTAVPGVSMATVTLGTRLDSTTDSIESLNGGTTKTLSLLPIALSTTSVATIAVPIGGNAIFYVTNLLLSSNATVRVSIKSGATYLTGNATIGINLNPGGGWVENGSPDSPVYIGLASGAAVVVEKNDVTTLLGGKIVYYQQ